MSGTARRPVYQELSGQWGEREKEVREVAAGQIKYSRQWLSLSELPRAHDFHLCSLHPAGKERGEATGHTGINNQNTDNLDIQLCQS